MSFDATYLQFLEELKQTFPEFATNIATAIALPVEEKRSTFLTVWRSHTTDIASQNSDIFTDSGIAIVPDVVLNKKLWSEISKNTQTAIWKYLSSLLLLAATETTTGWDISGFKHDIEEMIKKLKESSQKAKADGTGISGEGFDGDWGNLPGLGDMSDMLKKITEMASGFGFTDMPDLSGMKEKFKIPERMFKGHIAKIAQELVKEFTPEDFGITPDMVENADPARIFEILQDIFTKRPEMLATAAQKIAKRIQAKFQKGEIKREEIIQEAEELMKEFADNEMFSSLFGSLGEMMKGTEKSSGNEGSARRREVQERLRKKKAEKEAAKMNTSPSSNVVMPNTQPGSFANAQALADQAAASLLLEESMEKKTGRKTKK